MAWLYPTATGYRPATLSPSTPDDTAMFTIVYQEYVPPTPPTPPEETKIPMWVWIIAILGGAYVLLTRSSGGE